MPMLMMHVGHMGMRVHQSCMLMLMHVGFAGRVLGPMGMLVMFIMRVSVRMNYRFMVVDVLVALRNMKPHPESHHCSGNNQRERNWRAECKDGCDRAKKGGGREIRACSRRPQMTQGYDEQHQTHTIAQKSDHSRGNDRRDSWNLAAHP